MTLIFYTSGNDNISDYSDLGYLSFKFDETLLYDVDHCYSKRRFDFEQFPVTPPTEPNKIWTISKSFTDLTIDCNGVRVYMTHIAGYPGRYNRMTKKAIEIYKPDLVICGHSHILKVMRDKKYGHMHMNPGAIGRHGFHKVRTMLRFTITQGQIDNLEVLEYKR